MFVPVVDKTGSPLMPTNPWRANNWIKSKKATPFWSNGIFCVRLNVEPSDNKKQELVIGIDPGSKREAFTVKSEAHTYLNVLASAVTWVKDAVETRRNMRKTRRSRKAPYRKCRVNRVSSGIAPSTKARWQLKLRIVNRLRRLFPITDFIVEDIKAKTKEGQRAWNKSFSPLEVGKKWLYSELEKLGKLVTKQGYETYELRNIYGLKKSKSKLSESFDAHNVDSWVLANWLVGGHTKPDNVEVIGLAPLQFFRRRLHRLQPAEGGKRTRVGGTIAAGLKKGSITKNKKYGVCYVGGVTKNRLTLHSIKTGERLCRSIKVEDIKVLAYNSFRQAV